MKLYEISDTIAYVLDLIEEAGGEFTPELEAEYDAAFKDFESKLEGTAHVMLNLAAEAHGGWKSGRGRWSDGGRPGGEGAAVFCGTPTPRGRWGRGSRR